MATTNLSSAEVLSSPIVARAGVPRRFDSVDLLRGIVMVLMAIDHCRDFFMNLPYEPENMAHTYGALFFTRWVTHFCAPAFFLLAGTGSYLAKGSGKSGALVAGFLWKRGLWLIALELTVMGFAWSFIPGSSFGGVIWCLGWSMLALSVLVRAPLFWVGGIGAAMIVFHDLFDRIQPAALGRWGWLWGILHVKGPIQIGSFHYFILFPLIPWMGVMAVGYALGAVLRQPREQRVKLLFWMGAAMIALFIVLRATNAYGNPTTPSMEGAPDVFSVQGSLMMTVIAFLNVEKYPASLQFLLMTLGPALMALAWFDGGDFSSFPVKIAKPILVFGRVPMFYYVLHLYFIHLASLLVIRVWHPSGQSLALVWGMFFVTILVLYFPCAWFAGVKARRKDWWLRYL